MLFTGNAVFTSIAVGAMLMVAVALIGSLSILPALLSRSSGIASTRAGSRCSRGARGRRVAGLGLRARPRAAAPAPGGASPGRRPSSRSRCRRSACTRSCRASTRPAPLARHRAHVRVDPAGVPGRAPAPAKVVVRRRRRDCAAGAAGDRRPEAQRPRERSDVFEPISTETFNPPHGPSRRSRSRSRGNGDDATSVAALQDASLDRRDPGDGRRPLRGRRSAVTGETAGTPRLQPAR